MKILVTGAGGFIGSHLVESLVSDGHSVSALFRYTSEGNTGWLSESFLKSGAVRTWFGDVADSRLVSACIEEVDAVIHLAALIGIPYSYAAPLSYVQTNLVGTLNVLEACRLFGTKKLVLTSTSETYGSARYVPMDESHPTNSQSPYAASKAAADQFALAYGSSFDMSVTVLRPFNTFGPRQSVRAVIPSIIEQALRSDSVTLGNLDSTRDFTFVTDTVEGFKRALVGPSTAGRPLNIGNGFEISIRDVVAEVSRILGRNLAIGTDPQRLRPINSEVDRLWSDASIASEVLGWTPNLSGLDGFRLNLERTIEWYSARLSDRDGGFYRV